MNRNRLIRLAGRIIPVTAVMLMVGLGPALDFFDQKFRHVWDETPWVVSPDGMLRVRAEVRVLLSEGVIRARIESRYNAETWSRLADIPLADLPLLEARFLTPLEVQWVGERKVRIWYYHSISVMRPPFEVSEKSMAEIDVQ